MNESKKNSLGLWLGTIAVGAGLIGTSLYLYAKNGKVKAKKTKGGKGKKSKKGAKSKSKKSTRKPEEDLQAQKNAMKLPEDDAELKAELDAIKQVAQTSDTTSVGVALNLLATKAEKMNPEDFSNENRSQVAQLLMLHHDLLTQQMSRLPKNFGDMYKNKLKERGKASLVAASAWLDGFEDADNDEMRLRIAFKLEDFEGAAAVFDRLLAGPREPGTEQEFFLASMAPFLGKFAAFKELCQRNPQFLQASRLLSQSGQPDYQSFHDLVQPFTEDMPLTELKFSDFQVLSRQLLFKKMVDSDPERVESVSKTINSKTKDFIDLGPSYLNMVVKGALVLTNSIPVHMPQSLPLVGCLFGDSLKLQCVLRAPSNPISIEEKYDLKLVEKQEHDVLLYSGTYDFTLASRQEDGTYKDTTSFHYDCSFKLRSSDSTFANQPGPDFGKPVTLPAEEEKAKPVELEDEETGNVAELPSPAEGTAETSEETQETEQKAPAVVESETLESVIVNAEVVAESEAAVEAAVEAAAVEAVVEAVEEAVEVAEAVAQVEAVIEAVEEAVEVAQVAEAVAEVQAVAEAVEEAVEAAAVEAVVEEAMQAQAEQVIEAVAEAEAEAAEVVESVHSSESQE